MASIRYIENDVDGSLEFYRDKLGFEVDKHNPGKFAALKCDDLTLYLSAPRAGSGGTAGGTPEPGGWNRFMFVTDDIDAEVRDLKDKGIRFEHYDLEGLKADGDIYSGPGMKTAWFKDPDGNILSLIEES